jgi:hypothetical protein
MEAGCHGADGFFDLSDCYASLDAKKDPLIEINAVVPWDEFWPLLELVWRKPNAARKSRAGRKPMDVVLMFKTLVLSALYNLSDDQIEYQVRDPLTGRGLPANPERGLSFMSHPAVDCKAVNQRAVSWAGSRGPGA